jgi:hypothetical protein
LVGVLLGEDRDGEGAAVGAVVGEGLPDHQRETRTRRPP